MNKFQVEYSISLWNYLHYQNQSCLDSILANLREHNFGVEIWNTWRDGVDLYNPDIRKWVKDLLADMRVSFHTDIGQNSLDFHTRQIDLAADLTAKVLVLHSDNLYLDHSKELNVDLAKAVVEYAQSRGVSIALENGQLPFLAKAIDRVDGLGICLDIGHVYMTDDPLQKFLDTLKHRIIHLHIQDILSDGEMFLKGAEIGFDHYTPGTGGIQNDDWLLLFDTLQEIAYQGSAVFEIRPRHPLQTAVLGKQFVENLMIR